MDFPDFLKPTVTISIRRRRAAPLLSAVRTTAATGGAGASPGAQILNLPDLDQEQGHWCWAAVGMNIARFYDPLGTWSQCEIVNTALQRADCCSDPAASDFNLCNRDGYLEQALKITRCFASMTGHALAFADIQAELNQDRLIGCRVAWTGGGAHFLTLKGWILGESGIEYIVVSDPIYRSARIEASQFASAYQGGADWTHSYRTRPEPAPGGAAAHPGARIDLNVSHPEAIGA